MDKFAFFATETIAAREVKAANWRGPTFAAGVGALGGTAAGALVGAAVDPEHVGRDALIGGAAGAGLGYGGHRVLRGASSYRAPGMDAVQHERVEPAPFTRTSPTNGEDIIFGSDYYRNRKLLIDHYGAEEHPAGGVIVRNPHTGAAVHVEDARSHGQLQAAIDPLVALA